MASTPGSPPALSVILASRDPWPALRDALEALHGQVAAAGGEIVVAVDDPAVVAPDPAARYPAVTWVEEPGGSVFRLRAAALARCRGAIVAVTEDHAWVAGDWCARILEAHRQHPEAAAIGGVVENGATRSLRDWAGFFVANGPFLAPLRTSRAAPISQQANVSYKRRALAALPALGLMTHTLHEGLRARGETLVADERLVVHHVQRLSLAGHSAGHFHNGRSIAAFRVATMAPWWRPLRALGCLLLPPVMLWRTLAAVLPKRRHRGTMVAGLPLIVWFLCCHAAGEMLGYLAGPGGSPERVN